MKKICIFNDDELETEYLDVDICSQSIEQCPYGRATETLEFFFDKCIDHHPKKNMGWKIHLRNKFQKKLVFYPRNGLQNDKRACL